MEKYQILLDTVRQQYASVVWTHKIQEKQADLYAGQYKWLETINIIAAALTTCGIIGVIFNDGIALKVVTALISFVSVAISAYNKSFDLKTLSAGNKGAANQIIGIRNELIHVISELHMMEKDVADINYEFVEIMQRLNILYGEIPPTTDKAVKKAATALKDKKEYTFTDDEIDRYLPPALRGKIKKEHMLF